MDLDNFLDFRIISARLMRSRLMFVFTVLSSLTAAFKFASNVIGIFARSMLLSSLHKPLSHLTLKAYSIYV